MIDGIKLELKNPDFAHQIRLNPNFDFINEVNEKTGVIEDCKTAKYKNITIRVFNSGLVLITGSLHKFKNNGVHNYDDFNFNEVIVMIDEMQKLFEFDLNKVKIDNLEFGVNITPPIPTKEVLKHLVCHKREPFKQITYPNSDYRECKHQQFIIKIYDKAKQYNQTEQILRVEVKCFKMGELNRIGIYYLSDLLNIDVYPVLGQMLTETWDEILYIDHTVNTNNLTLKQRENFKNWRNPLYWQGLTEHPIKKKFNTEREKYQKTVHEHSEKIQSQISCLVSEKWEQLTNKSKPLIAKKWEQLTNNPKSKKQEQGKINHLYNEIIIPDTEKRCIVTGLSISMQKEESIFIGSTGVKWYLENEPETYCSTLSPILANSKYRNASIEKQIKEISHLIRDKKNNLYHNYKRDSDKRGAKLFDDSPFLTDSLKDAIAKRKQ